MKKSTVLVCGGAGYIGSHTSVELINAGYGVVIADNFSNSEMAAVEGVRRITGVDVPFVEVDCCDREAFRKVFEQHEFDSVIHFAASKAVGESVQKPMLYYRNNLTSLMNIIDLMREFGRSNIVFLVLHGLRRARQTARHRTDAPQTGHVALRQHETDFRGYAPRFGRRIRRIEEHRTAVFQSDRGPSVGAYRRTSPWGATEFGALHHPDGCRIARMSVGFRR